MNQPRPDEELEHLAAEHALGVLDGAELARARELTLSSPDFARRVHDWQSTIAPIAGEAAGRQPDPSLWPRIEKAVSQISGEGGAVVQLRRQLRLWKGLSLAATAAAATMLFFLALPDGGNGRASSPTAPTPVLVASLSSEQSGTSLSAAYDPADGSLLVTPGLLKGAAGHQHELWIIPEGGEPVAVGLVSPGEPQRLAVQLAIAPHFRGQSTLALSVEPTGGSPTGKPTGPVIASGQLFSI